MVLKYTNLFIVYSTEKILKDSAVSVAPPARPVQKASSSGAVATARPSTRQRVAEVMNKDGEESSDEDGNGKDGDEGSDENGDGKDGDEGSNEDGDEEGDDGSEEKEGNEEEKEEKEDEEKAGGEDGEEKMEGIPEESTAEVTAGM